MSGDLDIDNNESFDSEGNIYSSMQANFAHNDNENNNMIEGEEVLEEVVVMGEDNDAYFHNIRNDLPQHHFNHDDFIEEEIQNEAANYFSVI